MIRNNRAQEYTLCRRDTCAISNDNNRPLHCLSTYKPLSLHPLLHPRSFNTVSPQQVEYKTVFMLSICFWGLLTGNKKNVVTNLRVGPHSCLKSFTRVSNRYNSGLLLIWFKDSWAAPPLHLCSTENKVSKVSVQSSSDWMYSAGHRLFFETIFQEKQHQPFEQVPQNTSC